MATSIISPSPHLNWLAVRCDLICPNDTSAGAFETTNALFLIHRALRSSSAGAWLDGFFLGTE
ncbi:MAG: hypothetical protein ACPIOQ_65985, partial [Promethearchaeia archaeon]